MNKPITIPDSVAQQISDLIDADIISRYIDVMKTKFQLEDLSDLLNNDIIYNEYVTATVSIDVNGLRFVHDGRRETPNEFFYMWNLSDFNIRRNKFL